MVALTFHLFKWSTPRQPIVGAMILENIPLQEYTTFRIGGPARYFVCAETIEDVRDSLAFAHAKKIPVFILGGGSNILVSDEGFSGLVIKMEIVGIDIDKETITAGAGVNWDKLVACTVEKNLHGLENLSLIPGTVGAAPVQNIGAYGAEVKDAIAWVEVLDKESWEMKKLSKEECAFGYRTSIFKKPEGKKYIITRVAFALAKNGKANFEYKDLKSYFAKQEIASPAAHQVREAVIVIRNQKLPDVKKLGTAGSFFKNPIVSKEKLAELLKKFPEIVSFPVSNSSYAKASEDDFVKISAAWLLDKVCGFKGYREGDVGSYQNQALVLVNFGSASAKDIKSLAAKMSVCALEKTGIVLEQEVEYVS